MYGVVLYLLGFALGRERRNNEPMRAFKAFMKKALRKIEFKDD